MLAPSRRDDLSYRPHLDGLRAVAVVMVFFFHATPSSYGGGFLGVDVFFVLSGYLITRILIEEWDRKHSIDLGRFYGRRVRRLTPALATLLVVVLVRETLSGSILTFTDHMRDILATALYYANWNLVASSDDYFGGFAEASPLRHAWSLAIEEQFYFVWPVAVWLVLRLTKRRVGVVILGGALAIASIAAMWLIFDSGSVSAAYYRTDSRVHELLIGAMLGATFAHRPSPRLHGFGAFGLPALASIIALGAIWNSASARFFTGGSLAVALLAALLISAVEDSPTSMLARILSTKPFVALGRISYGFYLWHWPIILWFPFDDAPTPVLMQFLASLAAATASWFIVEQRFVGGSWFARKVPAMPTVAIGVSAMVIIGLSTLLADKPSASAAIERALDDPSSSLCDGNYPPCVKVAAAAGRPAIAILGDSTAQAWLPALEVIAAEHDLSIVQAAVGGCPIGTKLLVGDDGISSERQQQCFDKMPDAISSVAVDYDVRLVVATSRSELNAFKSADSGEIIEPSTSTHRESFITDIHAAVRPFLERGAQVALLEILPDGPPIDCTETGEGCEVLVADAVIEKTYNEMLRGFAETTPGVSAASMLAHVCPGRTCPLLLDGEVVRYDKVHFTGTMSRSFSDELERELREAGIDFDEVG